MDRSSPRWPGIHSSSAASRATLPLGEHRAELSLPARSAQEHHQPLRHRERQRTPQVRLDQRQRDIDAGSDTHGAEQMCGLRIGGLVGVQAIALHLAGGVFAQSSEVRPVGGRFAPVEQSRLGQD